MSIGIRALQSDLKIMWTLVEESKDKHGGTES